MRLHYREYGAGPPLLILHGLFGSLDNWHPIAQHLGSGFRVFALDLRNHGRSGHSSEMDYDIMARDIQEFVVEHRLQRVHLIGHSMGGKTAMQFALSHPEKMGGLVIVDVAPRAYPPAHQSILDALLSLDLKTFQTRQEADAALAQAIPDARVRLFLLKNLARNGTAPFQWRLGLEEIQRNYSRLNHAIESNRSFDKAVLFLRGANSDYIGERDVALIHRLFPRAEVRSIPGTGHWVHADAPDLFLEAVTDFLSGDFSDAE